MRCSAFQGQTTLAGSFLEEAPCLLSIDCEALFLSSEVTCTVFYLGFLLGTTGKGQHASQSAPMTYRRFGR